MAIEEAELGSSDRVRFRDSFDILDSPVLPRAGSRVGLLENQIAKSTDSAGNKELAYCSDHKRREEEIFQTATFAYSCSIRDSRIQDPLPDHAPASESQTSSSESR